MSNGFKICGPKIQSRVSYQNKTIPFEVFWRDVSSSTIPVNGWVMSSVWSEKNPGDTDAMIIMIAFWHWGTNPSFFIPSSCYFFLMRYVFAVSALMFYRSWIRILIPWLEKPLPSEFRTLMSNFTIIDFPWWSMLQLSLSCSWSFPCTKAEVCDYLGHLKQALLDVVPLFFNWICAGLPWSWNHYATLVLMD